MKDEGNGGTLTTAAAVILSRSAGPATATPRFLRGGLCAASSVCISCWPLVQRRRRGEGEVVPVRGKAVLGFGEMTGSKGDGCSSGPVAKPSDQRTRKGGAGTQREWGRSTRENEKREQEDPTNSRPHRRHETTSTKQVARPLYCPYALLRVRGCHGKDTQDNAESKEVYLRCGCVSCRRPPGKEAAYR